QETFDDSRDGPLQALHAFVVFASSSGLKSDRLSLQNTLPVSIIVKGLATKYFDELMVEFESEQHPLRGSPLGQDPSILAKRDLGLAYWFFGFNEHFWLTSGADLVAGSYAEKTISAIPGYVSAESTKLYMRASMRNVCSSACCLTRQGDGGWLTM
ncbi:MAG: hypothetical protein ACYCU8_07905, partial [Ferrimicrobium acidiphilum]